MTTPEPLFGVEVTTHPDLGQRVAWTVPAPDELRDRGVRQVERRASSWERAAIDKVLFATIEKARMDNSSFTANDVRPRLHEGVHGPLVAARFMAAAKSGRIVRVGYVRSDSPRTKGAVIAVWRPA